MNFLCQIRNDELNSSPSLNTTSFNFHENLPLFYNQQKNNKQFCEFEKEINKYGIFYSCFIQSKILIKYLVS